MKGNSLVMDIREILAQGLKDGVGGFFDSVIEQINEKSEQSIEEVFDECEKALEEIKKLLEIIGGTGKFEKFDDVDELYVWALLVASLVSGIKLEETNAESMQEFNDLFDRWIEARAFLESGVCKPGLIILEKKVGMPNMNVILDSFYEDISTLPYKKKGLFAIRITKKLIQPYSERVYIVCEMYGKLINIMREMLQ